MTYQTFNLYHSFILGEFDFICPFEDHEMLIHEDIEAILNFFTEFDGGLGVLFLIDYYLTALLEDAGGDAVAEENVHYVV